MTCEADDLIRDPLFQLNAVLWMTQPLPSAAEIKPLLYSRGFRVRAIAPPLAPPPDLQLRAQEKRVDLKASVRPDVIVADERGRFAVTECKASSFGPGSSTAEQARSLLVVGGPRCSEVLALSDAAVSRSVVAYVMPEDQRDVFLPTLAQLDGELATAKLSPGTACIMGLRASARAISVVADEEARSFFNLPNQTSTFLTVERDTCPRPLYFIPYDPDNEQSPAERKLCQRQLYERFLGGVVCATGRAIPPSNVLLRPERMLNDAMFGMFEHWENRDATRHMKKLCRVFMTAVRTAVEPVVPDAIQFEPAVGWHITLADHDMQERMLKALMRFSCEDLILGPPRPPDLFDSVEDD
ncbi:MAG: hypothetical protein ISS72_03325 [Candidatus Brocadiae bacterium]|nr:hypothetical protein [Candidatus Brocadiia bacterium]